MLKTIMAADAKRLMDSKLVEIGISASDAEIISNNLVSISLLGIDTHGIRLFETYVQEFEYGRANKQPNVQVERGTSVCCLMDADNGNGVAVGVKAMNHAVKQAKVDGLSLVVVKNSNHFGAASIYTRLAAARQCIGLCMSNSDALVALEHGLEAFLGTNPIAFSAPGKRAGFNLDFATSQVAFSKVMSYLATGETIPNGWAIDEQGQDSSLNQSVKALKPLGGYKGQGLGFMVQMLTSVLSGMPFDHQLSHLYCEPFDKPRQVSHFFLAINPAMFMNMELFCKRVDDLLTQAQTHSPAAIVPGMQELGIKREREKNGIPLSVKEASFFMGLAGQEN